jgi:hypothetical protein
MEPICPLSEAYCSRTASAEGISAPGLTVSVHSQYQRAAIRFSRHHTFPISLSQSDGSQGETVSRHKYRETSRTEVTDWSTVSAIRERPSVATWALCEPSTPVIRAAQPARLSKGVQLCRRLRLRAIPMKLVLNVTVARPDLGRLFPSLVGLIVNRSQRVKCFMRLRVSSSQLSSVLCPRKPASRSAHLSNVPIV